MKRLLILLVCLCLRIPVWPDLGSANSAYQAALKEAEKSRRDLEAYKVDSKGRPVIHSLKDDQMIELRGTASAKDWLKHRRELEVALKTAETKVRQAGQDLKTELDARKKADEPYDRLIQKAIQSRNTILDLRDKAGRDPEKACRAVCTIERDIESLQGPVLTLMEKALQYAETATKAYSLECLDDVLVSDAVTGNPGLEGLQHFLSDRVKDLSREHSFIPHTEAATKLTKTLRIVNLCLHSEARIPNDVALFGSLVDGVKEGVETLNGPVGYAVLPYMEYLLGALASISQSTQQVQLLESSQNLDLLVQWVDSEHVEPVLRPGGDRNRVLFGRLPKIGTCIPLAGLWKGQFELGEETLLITEHGNQVQAYKIAKTKDYVPQGQMSWKGDYTANPFRGQIQVAGANFSKARWLSLTVTIKSRDHLQLSDETGWTCDLSRVSMPPAK